MLSSWGHMGPEGQVQGPERPPHWVALPESAGTTGDPLRAVRDRRRAGLEGVSKEAREEVPCSSSLPDFSSHPHRSPSQVILNPRAQQPAPQSL